MAEWSIEAVRKHGEECVNAIGAGDERARGLGSTVAYNMLHAPGANTDAATALVAVQLDGDALQYADQTLQSNRVFVLAAVQKSPSAFKYADQILKGDQEIALAAVLGIHMSTGYQVIPYDVDALFYQVIPYVGATSKKRDFMLAALQECQGDMVHKLLYAFAYALEPDIMVVEDWDIMVEAVRRDPKEIIFFSRELRKRMAKEAGCGERDFDNLAAYADACALPKMVMMVQKVACNPQGEGVEVTLTTFTGDPSTVQCENSTADLRRHLALEFQCHPIALQLLLNGHVLADSDSLM